jgi:hypothetical protein
LSGLDDDVSLFDFESTSPAPRPLQPKQRLRSFDERTKQWTHSAHFPRLAVADIAHLVADGESVWMGLYSFGFIVHYDPTRNLCRAFLLDLPQRDSAAYSFVVDDKYVYLNMNREVWRMPK